MKLTAKDLYDLKVIDKIIKEPQKDGEVDFEKLANNLKKEIVNAINELKNLEPKKIVQNRYEKFRNMGEYIKL